MGENTLSSLSKDSLHFFYSHLFCSKIFLSVVMHVLWYVCICIYWYIYMSVCVFECVCMWERMCCLIVTIEGQLVRIYDQVGDTALGTSVREFRAWVNWGGRRIHLKCGWWVHSTGRDPDWIWRRKWTVQQHPQIHWSLHPACGRNAASVGLCSLAVDAVRPAASCSGYHAFPTCFS